jgi:hypothetical protein
VSVPEIPAKKTTNAMPLLEFNDSQDYSDRIHHAEGCKGWERRDDFRVCVLFTANSFRNFVRQVREKIVLVEQQNHQNPTKCYLAFSNSRIIRILQNAI